MTRILIVDDHAIIGGGLQQFLDGMGGLEVAGEARTGREALAMLRGGRWDLVLLDIGLPDMNGIELLKQARSAHPTVHFLVFSMHAEDEYAMTALDAGAIGYLQKDSAPDEILTAIRRAAKGLRYVSPALAEKLLAGTAVHPERLPHDLLSARELAVMQLLSKGMALTEISEKLHLSPKTVSTYRSRVLEKLNLANNAEITRYALQHGMGQ